MISTSAMAMAMTVNRSILAEEPVLARWLEYGRLQRAGCPMI
jgi:hypothetical protein